ncbi:glycoside hydrolase/deacetylase [Coprinopsis marcescibilis]|uniref:chitin deacetylase n=1 Tax=Coprinopsis marcescibilis TaxID=230819 RepID=A0A5C3L631_COPMA|nr:glycoside hydrolase/deacetylase [Coprinopsis marcescibilis]
MKSLSAVALLSLSAVVNAHGDHHHRRHNLVARQNSASATRSFTYSGATNPTAIPLPSIVAGAVSRPVVPIASTPAAGAKPTAGFSNAPGVPDLTEFRKNVLANKYPEGDKVPAVNSPEVLQWMEEVQNSGIQIPALETTVEGGSCQANLPLASDASRCWWTCNNCDAKEDVVECNQPNHWGISFDDGPGFYTHELLDYLDQERLKATFFVVGSRVLYLPEVLQAEHIRGHQIAIHSWSHRPLTTLTTEQVIAELGWSKKIIKDTLGITPNQMRPPFGDMDERVRKISLAMGLTPIMWTRSDGLVFNTEDFDVAGGTRTVQQVLTNWQNIIQAAGRLTDNGFLTLQHDLNQQSIDIAAGYIIPDGLARQLTIEPVITCLDMPMANAYIETNDNTTNPPTAKLGIFNKKATSAGVSVTSGTLGSIFVGTALAFASLFAGF